MSSFPNLISSQAATDISQIRQEVSDLREEIGALKADLLQQLRYMHDCLHWDMEARVVPAVDGLSSSLQAHDSKMRVFCWELYRREGESVDDARARFFRSLPDATGGMRLFQLASAKLLQEFDLFCRAHHFNYWLAFGTLLGAVRHEGFIPWDDDIDIAMMRSDFDSLIQIVEQDDRYRISIKYDSCVHSRQIRFCYADDDIPCFIDIFCFDWSPIFDESDLKGYFSIRTSLVEGLVSNLESNSDCTPDLLDMDSPLFSLADQRFSAALDAARDDGLVYREGPSAAVVWGLDNMFESNYGWACMPADLIFPLEELIFEGVSLAVPHNWDSILRAWYGDYLELPNDLESHYIHIDTDVIETDAAQLALRSLIDS